jgi:hypothetical protein
MRSSIGSATRAVHAAAPQAVGGQTDYLGVIHDRHSAARADDSIIHEGGIAMAKTSCPICKGAVQPGTLPEISGQEGPLALKVHHLPVLECPNGHRLFPNPDFPLLLVDQLVEGDEMKLPASTAKGMLLKQYYCASCGDKLADSVDAQRTFHIDVQMPQLEPFDVELTMPVHRCARCGHEQLHSLKEVRSRTPAALAHAFKAAAIAAPA